MIFAGLPIATCPFGISCVTTEPAPISVFSPMIIPGRIIDPAPITALFFMVGPLQHFLFCIGACFLNSGQGGWRTFAPVPIVLWDVQI